jgi:hypothetical protein
MWPSFFAHPLFAHLPYRFVSRKPGQKNGGQKDEKKEAVFIRSNVGFSLRALRLGVRSKRRNKERLSQSRGGRKEEERTSKEWSCDVAFIFCPSSFCPSALSLQLPKARAEKWGAKR